VLGLPLSVASTVPSITHVISLTTYEVKQLPEGERKVPTKVVEQRATNFLIHVLIGSALSPHDCKCIGGGVGSTLQYINSWVPWGSTRQVMYWQVVAFV